MSEPARPPNGYHLSLYDHLRRRIPELQQSIAASRAHIERLREHLEGWQAELAHAESTLAWMREHQADEIAEVEARRETVRAKLREAGWNV